MAVLISRTSTTGTLWLTRIKMRAFLILADLAQGAIEVVNAFVTDIRGADTAPRTQALAVHTTAAIGARLAILEAAANTVKIDATGALFTRFGIADFAEARGAAIDADIDGIDARACHLDAFLFSSTIGVTITGWGTGPPTTCRRTFQTFSAGIIAVAGFAGRGVATLDAQRHLTVVAVEVAAGRTIRAGRVTALTGLITTSVVFIS